MAKKNRLLIGSSAALLILVFASIAAAAAPQPIQTVTPTPAAGDTDQATGTATADPAADTSAATLTLRAGFILDPFILPVVGTGDTPAAEMLDGCNGFVGQAPDVTLNWSGKVDRLSFFGYSDSDPVLVVQQPDGSFVCNDDAGLTTVDPLVVIEDPADGAYEIYVGAARKEEPALGFLGISAMPIDDAMLAELDLRPMLTRRERPRPQPVLRLAVSSLLANRPAIFGTTELAPGFAPIRRFVAGGGDIPAFTFEDGQLACAGYVSPVPSYSFGWTGDVDALRLYFEARQDSTLAVVTPDQQVLCNVNAGKDNLNPALDIPEPAEGQYKVYIASMEPETVVGGRLTITEETAASPSILTVTAQ